MTEQKEKCCSECRHFDAFEPDRGQCRRYAPRAGFFQTVFAPAVEVDDKINAAVAVWPEVEGHDFCGEWERER
jgi:hypothetical protein